MIKRLFKKIIITIMKTRGYSSYFAPKVVKETIADFKNTSNISLKQKIWAYRKGFLSQNIVRYGLNEENYKNYMPDFTYYKLHPINKPFSKWIDDKLTLKYILSPFNDFLPKYYYYIKKGNMIRLMDCPKEYDNNIASVSKLLQSEEDLALKLVAGSLGKGFYKLSYKNGNYLINNRNVSFKDFSNLLSGLDNYTITEYLISHEDIRKIYPGTVNNLRVMLINDEQQNTPQIIGSFMKFGTKKSGVIEHIWAGGILCRVDIENGEISQPLAIKDGQLIEASIHPDTGAQIEGNIPHWPMIKKKLCQIAKYIPQIKYMGVDIVITDDKFKILEINSHQGINLMQVYYPLMENECAKNFFKKLM